MKLYQTPIVMKKIYSLIVALTITSLGFGQIISQYVDTETGTVPKGIEIWNNTAGTLNFATNNLVIQQGTNGGGAVTVYTLSTGTLTSGAVLVIGTTGTLQTVTTSNGSAFYNFAFQFNGNDALIVRYGATITDRFGTVGGTANWTGSGVSSADQNIALKSGITTGQAAPGFTNPSLRFNTISTTPSASGAAGLSGFGIAPVIPCTPPTTQASAYNTTGITTTTATLRWTPSGSGNNVLVAVRKNNPINADPTNGTNYVANTSFGIGDQIGTLNYVVYKGTDSSVTVTGLEENTNYHIAIFEYATSGTCFNITELTGNFTTLCTTVATLPFSEGFEGGVVPPSCWTTFRGINNVGTTQDWKISASGDGNPSGGFAAQVNAEDVSPSISQDWLVTPAIEMNVTENNQLTFFGKDLLVDARGSTYSVRVSETSQTDIASFVTLATYTEVELGNSFNQKVVDLTAYDGSPFIYIAFVMEQTDGFGDAWVLDDVEVTGDCIAPITQASNFSATSINQDAGTATLNWTRGSGDNVLVVLRAGSPVDTDPESGIPYTSSPNFGSGNEIGTGNFVVYNGDLTTVDISGLMSSATYYVAIYEYNDTATCYNLDELVGSFFLPCTSFDLPFTEGFETNLDIPDCWAVFDNGVDTGISWEVTSDSPNTGSNSAYLQFGDGFSGIAEDWLVSPAIDLTSVPFSELTFFSRDDDPFTYSSSYSVRISTTSQTDAASFTTVATYTEEQLGNLYNQKTINLTPFSGSVIYVAFVMEQDLDLGGDSWFLDDISIKTPVLPVRSFWYEPFTNNAQYDTTLGAEGSNGNTNYFFITDGSTIDKIYTGNNGNFFAAQDVDDVTGGASPSQLTWSNINISRYSQLVFSGEFASTATNTIDVADFVTLEYRLDGGAWTNLIAFENDGTASNTFFLEDTNFDGTGDGSPLSDTFQAFTKSIPGIGALLDLRLTVSLNSGSEDIAFEDFRLEGIGTGFEGNDAVGFGGAIGESTLEVLAFQAPTIQFQLTRGSGDFNDDLVIYIDSKAGGIENTTNSLTDQGDRGRKAISGINGSDRASVVFPPGFSPDYAISMNNTGGNLFEIVAGGAHNFIQSINLMPTGSNNAAVYNFNIEFNNIQTTPSQQGFKFLATYINGNNAFRSNETYGRNTAGTTNPGLNSTLTMETYYQVTSGLQGGIAPTIAPGAWSLDSVWLNENPPLPEDVITINDNVNLNIDATVINGLTLNADFNILETYSLATNAGITGPGSFDVSGTFTLLEGGFTNIIPTYADGATLEYRNIPDTYNRFNEWTVGDIVGAGVPDFVIIDNTDLDLSALTGNTVDANLNVGQDLSLINDASINIDAYKSLTVGGNVENVGSTVNLRSTTNRYSSLIANSTSGSGDFVYDRFTNGQPGVGVGAGGNDLISAPFTGQTFESFGTDPDNANS